MFRSSTVRKHSRRLGRRSLVGVTALFVALAAAGCGSDSGSHEKDKNGLTTVTVAIPNPNMTYMPLYVGQDLGLYKKYGIDLQVKLMEPTVAVQAAANGDVDFVTAGNTAVISAVKGMPLRTVAITANKVNFVMVGAPGITSVSDLKGKSISGQSAVSPINIAETAILKKNGVDPSEVQTVNIGGGSEALVSLVTAGKVAATVMDYAVYLAGDYQSKGLTILDDARFMDQPFGGLATSTKLIQSDPDLVRNVIKATLEATAQIANDEDKVLPTIERTQSLSGDQAGELWDFAKEAWVLSGKPSDETLANGMMAAQMALTLPDPPEVDKAFDFSLLPTS